MAGHSLFTLTFTQGLILGQLSIIVLLVLVLKYLFLDSTDYPFETSSYHHPRVNGEFKNATISEPNLPRPDSLDGEPTEWLNGLLQEILEVYRSRLRNDLTGLDGDEVARKRIEDYANKIRPQGFLDYIQVHSVDLGQSAPRLSNGRRIRKQTRTIPSETSFDMEYADSISLSLSTSYLFNYPMSSFARLPVSLTISLCDFRASISVSPPLPSSPNPALRISVSPNFTLNLTTTSLMGGRAKLANVPKLHELIQHQVRRVIASRATWEVPLPALKNH